MVVGEIIDSANTTKNAGQGRLLMHSGRGKPTIAEGLDNIEGLIWSMHLTKLGQASLYRTDVISFIT